MLVEFEVAECHHQVAVTRFLDVHVEPESIVQAELILANHEVEIGCSCVQIAALSHRHLFLEVSLSLIKEVYHLKTNKSRKVVKVHFWGDISKK